MGLIDFRLQSLELRVRFMRACHGNTTVTTPHLSAKFINNAIAALPLGSIGTLRRTGFGC